MLNAKHHENEAFVVAQAGNMVTGGPAKTAAALRRTRDSMTPEQIIAAIHGEEEQFGAQEEKERP